MASPSSSEPPALDLSGSRSGRRADRAFSVSSLGAGLTVLAVLALIVVATTNYAWPAFRRGGLGYFTGTTWSSQSNTYGILPLVYGTLVTSAIAVVIAVPVSLGVALFVTEVCPRRLRAPLTSLVDLLAAVPSVVFGLVGLLAFHDTAPAGLPGVRGGVGERFELSDGGDRRGVHDPAHHHLGDP